jgi:hypothetical protein
MTRFSLHRGTAAGVSYRYLLSEVKRDQTGIGVLTVLHPSTYGNKWHRCRKKADAASQ